MKKIKSIIILLQILFTTAVFAQINLNSDYVKDLDFVYANLKKSTSYETQNNKEIVQRKYNELREIFKSEKLTLIETYIKFFELTNEVKDLHNVISGNTERFSYEDLSKPDFLQKIKNDSNYTIFPKSRLSLDSLEVELSKRKINDYEGIYFYKNYFKIAIVKNKNRYEGIILETKISSWEKGETILFLIPKENNSFRLIAGNFIDKRLNSTNDFFSAGTFLTTPWKKFVDKESYYNVDFPEQKFVMKNLDKNIKYLKLGSFNSTNDGIKEATDFYNKEFLKISKKDILIVDLRNNYGGGDRTSKQFYKFLKSHKSAIYILVNYNTVSNAEQFVIKLKNKKNVTVVGDRTRGMITYGRNYNDDKEVPSKNFTIHFSDMKDNWKKYLKYEEKGITPNINLNLTKNWIEQITEIIKNATGKRGLKR